MSVNDLALSPWGVSTWGDHSDFIGSDSNTCPAGNLSLDNHPSRLVFPGKDSGFTFSLPSFEVPVPSFLEGFSLSSFLAENSAVVVPLAGLGLAASAYQTAQSAKRLYTAWTGGEKPLRGTRFEAIRLVNSVAAGTCAGLLAWYSL